MIRQAVEGGRRMDGILSRRDRVYVAPSLLAADFSRLGEEAESARSAGADLIHVDCMDGHFVPNLTIGPCVVKALREATDLPLDVHLMLSEPSRYLEDFIEAGADMVSFHLEAEPDPGPLLELLKQRGVATAIALNPDTAVERVRPYLDMLDMILVMSVFPGFGGQSFIEDSVERISTLREWVGPDFLIQVDGGIDPITAPRALEAGANVFVAGTSIFGKPDRKKAIRELCVRGEG